MNPTATDFPSITELPGEDASSEQIERLHDRYYWARNYCENKDVLEVACGAGQGLGYLKTIVRSLKAGDISEPTLKIARKHYGDRIQIDKFDAQKLPYEDDSFDVVLLYEAIYYLPSVDEFLLQCCRVLRKTGTLLIVTTNKDLYDFHPSRFSTKYFGVRELNELLGRHGFSAEFFGQTSTAEISWRQRILRPIKKIATLLHLMPGTMAQKRFLKRLVFGRLEKTPSEIHQEYVALKAPRLLPNNRANREFKVIYCGASLTENQ